MVVTGTVAVHDYRMNKKVAVHAGHYYFAAVGGLPAC